jgi:hypothetical protein
LLGLLLTIATTCDARMIIGTEAQEDSLRDQLRSLSERLVSRDQVRAASSALAGLAGCLPVLSSGQVFTRSTHVVAR